MDKKGEFGDSRAELIHRARENCSRNLQNTMVYQSQSVEKVPVSTDIIVKGKIIMVRWICAILLFSTVIAFDQLHINYYGIQSSTIHHGISSNDLLKQIETKLTKFTEDKIIPVFNRLK